MPLAPALTEPPLDPVPSELVDREVSVRVLLPLWHAAAVHELDLAQVTAGVPYDRKLLTNPRERVSWAAYTRIVSNMGALLDQDAMVACGAITLESPVFRAMLIPGRLLFGVADVYQWVFGPAGRASEMIVCQRSVIRALAPGHLRLELRMRAGYAPSPENYLLARGLLTGVSQALGAGPARVEQRSLPDGVDYDIHLPTGRSALRSVREAFSWVFAARSAGQALERAHAELHERYMELQRALEVRTELEAERQRLEEQLRHAQKMDAIGRLAGGVAHDFNNMLSVILSYSDLVLQNRDTDASTRHRVGEIQKAGQRAASLTRQLLAFSRQEVVQPQVLDLNHVIDDMHDMLHHLVGEDVTLTTVARDGLGKIEMDRGHVEQVIVNLIVNARDAMPKGGPVTVETANVELDERYAAEHLGVSAGPHVMLAVSDTGVGMDKATQARIFEPFFTTKEKGKGTGLGLSTVFGIVKQAAGSIWLYSEPGRGTTIKIYFRRTDSAASQASHPKSKRPVDGTETILVVDDEDLLRAVTCVILRDSGYHVLEAANGAQALRVVEQHPGTIDLLLTDVVMPEMSGPELAEQVVAARPGIKVIYMSGYTDDAVVRHGALSAELVLLQKPVTAQLLLSQVRATLVV